MNELSKKVLAAFGQLSIEYELHRHVPVLSAADRFDLHLDFDACICKNLLVTTRNESRFLLLMFPVDKEADLKEVRAAMGTSRLGFASQERLMSLLGEKPGSVGISGLINDKQNRVEVVLDASLRNMQRIAMHPGDNTQTVVISFSDMKKYIDWCRNKVYYLNF